MEREVYPKHLYEQIRREIGVDCIRHELRKYLPSIKGEVWRRIDQDIEGWFDEAPFLYPVRDFWNGVHGIMMGFKLYSHLLNFITGENVTAKKEAEDKLQYISLHDSLTGLYNRPFFEEELKRLNTERQHPLSVIIGDVNGLKILNDTFGHLEGDQLLKKTAEILQKCCRQEDIISRWGGDEYAIILPQTDRETAIQICDRIRNECQMQENNLIPISISLGVSTKSLPIQDFQKIIIDAEENMYQEKLIESDHYRRKMLSTFINNLKPKTWHSTDLCRLCLWFGMVLNLPY